ncbi:hypothetical protein [Pontibacillus yanchengensis]|uniref:Uncharacterized protein n=1 Tax=Pontibacillus yanchengensis Y32 TaxID=1385514 RepID=A0A0A2T5G0_9BACI|nr:hypothetical protein [Pontibacillus yanchengensis]KGP71032.1 hypothetical protein N782_01830 [Pontibacillus yanchengensis Y32]
MFVITLLIIGGCSENSSKIKDKIKHFPSKHEALEYFIKDENIRGNIDLVTTTKSDQLLVIQWRENIYFVGELNEDDKGYYTGKISANVHMKIGGAWELNTMDGNEYTIFFDKTNEKTNSIKLSNEEYFISIEEGHTLSNNSLNGTTAIDEVDTIKGD